MKVFLREKKLQHGKKSLYLDFYPPVKLPGTEKPTRREHLKLHIYEKPKNDLERNHNKETKLLAENLKARRQLELQAGIYNFISNKNKQQDFLEYFQGIVNKKRETVSQSNYYLNKATLQHFRVFTKGVCRFADVTESLCEGFKDYLLGIMKPNSAETYFTILRIVVNKATSEKYFAENPFKNVKNIVRQDANRPFLTIEELRLLANTPFKYEDLRRAALFSAMTGLRFSDIKKLTWKEIETSDSQGSYIRFTQQKTKGSETLFISSEAVELLGDRKEPNERVFKNLKKQQCQFIEVWTTRAGIDKHITFHCFRHTYAVLQLTYGTDIYTLSKLLGHREIKTTQIYAKIVDQKKRDAASKIKLK